MDENILALVFDVGSFFVRCWFSWEMFDQSDQLHKTGTGPTTKGWREAKKSTPLIGGF